MSETPNMEDPAKTAEGLCGEALEDAWRAWRPGQEPPRWPDFLPAPGRPCPAEQAFYLVQTDLEFRARAGLPGLLGQPYFRHPRLVQAGVRLGAAQQVELIRWEYQQRWQGGDRARAADYRAAFPDHAAALHDLRPRWTCPACRRPATAPEDEAPAALHCPGCGATVPAEAVFRPRAAPAVTASDSDTLAGHTLGKPDPALPDVPGYELLGELGRGGMGVVYRARQKGLNRLVALKMVLAGEYAGAGERGRFRSEAEAVARLQHPNIVQIHEVGEAGGRPFFALEFVAGGSLADRLGGQPQPAWPAAGLVETLARAVHHAHERGIVHRDLKPANILLQLSDCKFKILDLPEEAFASGKSRILNLQSEIPKVTDFGLAKRLDGATGPTQTGAVLGTPSYMAPEQAEGRGREVGPATDVYALGAILYELLTGRPPFKAETAYDTILQVVRQDPVPPRLLRPNLPRDLETICLKCLRKEPPRRYASALALADDLRRFQAGEPIQARPVGLAERAGRWCRRNPVLATSAALAAVAVVGGWLLWTAAEQRQFEVEQRRRRQAEAHRSSLRSSTEANTTLALAELHAGRFGSAQQILEEMVRRLADEPSLARQSADLRDRLERVRHLAGFYRLANEAERAITEREEPVYAEEKGDRAPPRLCENALRELGVLDRDRWPLHLPDLDLTDDQRRQLRNDVYRQFLLLAGVRAQAGVLNFGSRKLALVYRGALRAVAAARQFRPDSYVAGVVEAFCLLGLGQSSAVKPLKARAPQTAAGHYFTGMLHCWVALAPADPITRLFLSRGREVGLDADTPLVTAEENLRAAASLEPRHYWTHYWLGTTLVLANNPQAAELAYGACVALRPDYGIGYSARAQAILAQAEATTDGHRRGQLLDRALANLNEGLRLDSDHAPGYMWRSFAHFLRGRPDQALADADRAVARNPKLTLAYWVRASIYASRKQPARAIADYGAGLRVNPKDALLLAGRGSVYHDTGRTTEAVADLTQALRLNPKLGWVYVQRSEAYCQQAKYDEAVADATRAVKLDAKNARAYNARAQASWAQGKHDQAIADYTAALRIAPGVALYHGNRGAAYFKARGDYDKALADLNEAIRLDPKYVLAYCGRSEVSYQQGKYDQAVADATRAIQLDPRCAQALNDRGNALVAQNKYDQAIADYTAALKFVPREPVYFSNRGGAYKAKGEYEKALADLSEAIRLNSRLLNAYFWRGETHYHRAKYEEAIADLTQALRLDPRLALAYNARGNAWWALHNYDQALTDYTAALRITPRAAVYLSNRGGVFKDKGDCDKALADLNEAIRLDPKFAASYCWRGEVYDQQAKSDLALADLTRALELDPRLVPAYRGRARTLGRLGRYAEAVRDWDRVIELDGGNAGFRLERALALARAEDHARAAAEANALARGEALQGDTLYDLARVYALASSAVRRDANLSAGDRDNLARQHAARAVALLGRAKAAGYYQGPRHLKALRTSPDLEPLRSRDDFKKLLAGLEKEGKTVAK